jgi:MFS transporter, UMF1 family
MTPRIDEHRPPPHLIRNLSSFSKASAPSSHDDADDERSTEDNSQMESNPLSPQYEGEDTRLTSDKELSGFYMYGWAAEVSSISPPP